MTTTILPHGFYAKIYEHPSFTQVIVHNGHLVATKELPTPRPNQTELASLIEEGVAKIQKIIQSN